MILRHHRRAQKNIISIWANSIRTCVIFTHQRAYCPYTRKHALFGSEMTSYFSIGYHGSVIVQLRSHHRSPPDRPLDLEIKVVELGEIIILSMVAGARHVGVARTRCRFDRCKQAPGDPQHYSRPSKTNEVQTESHADHSYDLTNLHKTLYPS